MKTFQQFNEDSYAARQGAGAWLTGKAFELGARGIKQGYRTVKAITSFASKKKDDVNITPRNLKNLENAVFRDKTDKKLDNEIRRQRNEPPEDIEKELNEPQKPKEVPSKKRIKDLAKDNIKTRGSEAVKGQLLDKAKNKWRDNKIADVIANTEKGSIERVKGLKGIPKAKKIPDPPKLTDLK